MAIKIKKKSENRGKIGRKVCVACIVNGYVLSRIADVFKPNVIENPHINSIITWCVDYYKDYGRPPRETIQDVFNQKIKKTDDEDKVELLENILLLCSSEFERDCENFNQEYYLDLATEFFTAESIRNTIEQARIELDGGNVLSAEETILSHSKIEHCDLSTACPLTDADELYEAFEGQEDNLLSFKGALGEMWNENCKRDNLLAILGPQKAGKTFWLQQFLLSGVQSRLNVVYFSVGDMSRKQMQLRNAISIAGKNNRERYCKAHYRPVIDCKLNQDDSCDKKKRQSKCGLGLDTEDIYDSDFSPLDANKKYKVCSACKDIESTFWYEKIDAVKPLTWREAFKTNIKYARRHKGRDYKLVCTPNGSTSITDIDNQLNVWADKEGFVADLVIIDYMDIAAPEPASSREFRHQVNEKWKAVRALSQKWHCLVVTASQADAKSTDQDLLNRSNFSEDTRILAHVTGMYGLNKTSQEARLGLMRINEIVVREDAYFSDRSVTVLQDLAAGRPHLASFWT